MSWARGFAEVSLPQLGTSRRDRSRESFAPTHSARTPLVAARGEHRLELPASRRRPSGVSWHERAWLRFCPCERDLRLPEPWPAPLRSRFRVLWTGPPLAHPREGERDPLHPRCLPSSDSPCRGSPRPPQAVPSLWSGDAGAFFVPRAARAFDEASGSARTRSCAERNRLQEPGTPPLRPQRLQTTSTFDSIRG
jgi:hypothetical protein